MTVLENIEEIISWYNKQYPGAPLDQYMDAKSKLITLCYRFAGEVASAKLDSVMATVFRKAAHHERKSQLIEEGFSAVKAESKTIAELKQQMQDEATKEAIAYKSEQILKIALRIVDDLGQRIAVLRHEKENT